MKVLKVSSNLVRGILSTSFLKVVNIFFVLLLLLLGFLDNEDRGFILKFSCLGVRNEFFFPPWQTTCHRHDPRHLPAHEVSPRFEFALAFPAPAAIEPQVHPVMSGFQLNHIKWWLKIWIFNDRNVTFRYLFLLFAFILVGAFIKFHVIDAAGKKSFLLSEKIPNQPSEFTFSPALSLIITHQVLSFPQSGGSKAGHPTFTASWTHLSQLSMLEAPLQLASRRSLTPQMSTNLCSSGFWPKTDTKATKRMTNDCIFRHVLTDSKK